MINQVEKKKMCRVSGLIKRMLQKKGENGKNVKISKKNV